MQTLVEKAQAGEAVVVKRELMRLTNNFVTRMVVSHRCSGSEDVATRVRELMGENMELPFSSNLFDFFPFGKKLELQGLQKRAKKARGEYDEIMERIMKAHEEERRKNREVGST